MARMEQQLVIDPRDLSLSIECTECHSQLVLGIDKSTCELPEKCPGCNADWPIEKDLRKSTQEFINTFRALRKELGNESRKTEPPKIILRLKASPCPAEVPKGQ